MSAQPTTAVEAHRRTRRDHALETAQDYVRAIRQLQRQQDTCRVVDLARWFGVSHVTVVRTVSRLKRENLIASDPYGPIELTDQGRTLAAQSVRNHQIVFNFLRTIGVAEDAAIIDAEGIEHHVSRQTLDCFRRMATLMAAAAAPAAPTTEQATTADGA